MRPRNVKHGIKIRTKKGDIGKSWLAQRWIDLMEEASPEGQFTSGRTYARKGQVLSVTTQKGKVTGKVQGAPIQPHDVSILIDVHNNNYAEKIAKVCQERPILATKILSGEMTESMEMELYQKGVRMFDYSWSVKVHCDCYHWGSICKHAAALCYVLAEEFDYDSFLYWKILGVERDTILQNMKHAQETGKNASGYNTQHVSPEYSCVMGGVPNNYDTIKPTVTFEPKSIPLDLRTFWGSNHDNDDSYEDMGVPTENAAILKRLGGFPMWCGTEKFLDVMNDIYEEASIQGAHTYTGMRAGLNMKNDAVKQKGKKT